MSNNFQPAGTLSNLINEGFTLYIPAAGSDDAQLLLQQTDYAARCDAFVAGVKVARNGQDVTNDAQRFFLRLIQNTPMTATAAQAYFSGVQIGYWTSSVIDYKAAYAALISTPFPA